MQNPSSSQIDTTWCVVGAGPAGVAVVGKLLDAKVPAKEILWIDSAFQGGDLGTKWRPVSSNTKVGLFLDFLKACPSFHYGDCPVNFELNSMNPQDTCLLQAIADPLIWITKQLQEQVCIHQGMVEELEHHPKGWVVKTRAKESILAKKIVLAIGADPKSLSSSHISASDSSFSPKQKISIEQMVDLEKLSQVCSPQDTVAVFGSSHSAIIALYNLQEIGARVVNFYRSPLKYAIYKDGWILYDNTGLKGYSATWAKKHMSDKEDGTILDTLERVHLKSPQFTTHYDRCNKIIEAIGFDRRHTIKFPASLGNRSDYDHTRGEIAPGLYGVGIAFPEGACDPEGNFEYRVGLWKFMDYITRVLPTWM